MVTINNIPEQDAAVIREIAPLFDIVFARRINKGSEDKIYAETSQGEKRLIYISKASGYWKKDNDGYAYVAEHGIIAPKFISEGFNADNSMRYKIWTWLEGEDVSTVLSRLQPDEQYALGKKCGEVARKIHSLPPIGEYEPWETRCKRKVEKIIKKYYERTEQYPECEVIIKYLRDNMDLLNGRPTTCFKGDWNGENLIVTPAGEIGIIDGLWGQGDPWGEGWEISHDVDEYLQFFIGQFHGYFNGEPPIEYFKMFAFYVAVGYLEWYPNDAGRILEWYDNMQNPIPSWYSNINAYLHSVD